MDDGDDRPVLLVIVGVGDWATRRVIIHARDFASGAPYAVDVALVDVRGWTDLLGELARQLNEQAAEELDGVTISVPVASGGDDTPDVAKARRYYRELLWDPALGVRATLTKGVRLPRPPEVGIGDGAEDAIKAIKKFIERFFAEFVKEPTRQELEEVLADPKAREALRRAARDLIEERKTRTLEQCEEIMDFLGGSIPWEREVGETVDVPRYWRSTDGGEAHELEGLGTWQAADVDRFCGSYRMVIVYADTPPHVYPQILRTWVRVAHRIAFEKPLDGLLGDRRTTPDRRTTADRRSKADRRRPPDQRMATDRVRLPDRRGTPDRRATSGRRTSPDRRHNGQ